MSEADKRLPDDCRRAAECLACTATFETGQALLNSAADRIEALEAQLTDAERRGAERMRERAARHAASATGDINLFNSIRALSLTEEEG